MKRILFSVFIGLIFANLLPAIEAGDAQRDVATALGNPVAVLKKTDGTQVWKFRNGTTVWLADSIVQRIAGPTVGNLVRRAGSAVWVSLPPRPAPATAPPAAIPRERGKLPAEIGRIVSYLLLFSGLAVVVGALRCWMILVPACAEWLFHTVFIPLASSVLTAISGSVARIKRAWRWHFRFRGDGRPPQGVETEPDLC